ncbi:MAG: holo-ACP synthase [Chlorobiaceae bacterium]|nr:holo-ACP synthase [Chlorobiaceae bacterium]
MEIGVDIVEICRIRALYERFGAVFMRRILTEAEMAQCLSRPDPVASLAGRFAAKEAVSKALGTGISGGLSFHSIEVLNDEAGKPLVTLHPAGLTGAPCRICLSISHDRHSAIAMVLVEPA